MPHRRESHENPGHARHRQVVYAQVTNELMRESYDLGALEAATHRALRMNDVAADPELAAMVRSFAAQREAELRASGGTQKRMHDSHTQPHARSAPDPKADAVATFDRIRRDYEEQLAEYNVDRAAISLKRLEELLAKHHDVLNKSMIERCKMDFVRVESRRAAFLEEVRVLEQDAMNAASRGELDVARDALRRLAMIHSTRPELLSADRLEQVRDQISRSGDQADIRDATHELVTRERAISAEIRALADTVHRFHEISREIPHGDPKYLDAEREYLQAVRNVRTHDKNWIADLMIEMGELVERLHDPSGRADSQVTRFIESVRGAIGHVVREIREIAAEQKGGAANPPAAQGGKL